MDYTLSASYYQKEKWSALWTESQTITIPPKIHATVDVTLIVQRFANWSLSRIFKF